MQARQHAGAVRQREPEPLDRTHLPLERHRHVVPGPDALGPVPQLPAAPTAAAYYNNGQPQTIEFDFDPSPPGGDNNVIDVSQSNYTLIVYGLQDVQGSLVPISNIMAHSLTITMNNITTMAFE
jgi:hypothetical protein